MKIKASGKSGIKTDTKIKTGSGPWFGKPSANQAVPKRKAK